MLTASRVETTKTAHFTQYNVLDWAPQLRQTHPLFAMIFVQDRHLFNLLAMSDESISDVQHGRIDPSDKY